VASFRDNQGDKSLFCGCSFAQSYGTCSASAEASGRSASTSRDLDVMPRRRRHTEFLFFSPGVRLSKRVLLTRQLPAGIARNNEMVIALSEAAGMPHSALHLQEGTVPRVTDPPRWTYSILPRKNWPESTTRSTGCLKATAKPVLLLGLHVASLQSSNNST
jgi:hypothetical protein